MTAGGEQVVELREEKPSMHFNRSSRVVMLLLVAFPASLAVAAAMLLALALIAICLTARRAGRVDPVEVLRTG